MPPKLKQAQRLIQLGEENGVDRAKINEALGKLGFKGGIEAVKIELARSGGKPPDLTDTESKDIGFASAMANAVEQFAALEAEGVDDEGGLARFVSGILGSGKAVGAGVGAAVGGVGGAILGGAATGPAAPLGAAGGAAAGATAGAGLGTAAGVALEQAEGPAKRLLQNPGQERFGAATMLYANAVLRKETGATINDSEMGWVEGRFIPLPGDSPELREQKRQNRLTALVDLAGNIDAGAIAQLSPRTRAAIAAAREEAHGGARVGPREDTVERRAKALGRAPAAQAAVEKLEEKRRSGVSGFGVTRR